MNQNKGKRIPIYAPELLDTYFTKCLPALVPGVAPNLAKSAAIRALMELAIEKHLPPKEYQKYLAEKAKRYENPSI